MQGEEGKDEPRHSSANDGTTEQSAAELLHLKAEIQRPKPRPGLLALFSAYLLLVGTVIGGGMLASYAGHGTAMQIIFYVSVVLLLLIPVVLACYLAFSIHRRYPLLKKIMLFVEQHTSAIMSACAVIALAEIVRCVWRFPVHPRLYIAEMLVNLLTIVMWIIMLVMRRFERIYDILNGMNDNTRGVVRILENLSKRLPPAD